MTARPQYELTPTDLHTLLSLTRGGSLAAAGERLGLNASTVFRQLRRIERGLGQVLFERKRSGLAPVELALQLAEHAEQMETPHSKRHARPWPPHRQP
jgi:DNA-binding transcriptional LysR family regulator